MFARWHWTFDLKSCKEFSKQVPRYILLIKFRSFRDSVPLYSFISFLRATETTAAPLQVIRVTVTELVLFCIVEYASVIEYVKLFLFVSYKKFHWKFRQIRVIFYVCRNYFFVQANASIVRTSVSPIWNGLNGESAIRCTERTFKSFWLNWNQGKINCTQFRWKFNVSKRK